MFYIQDGLKKGEEHIYHFSYIIDEDFARDILLVLGRNDEPLYVDLGL